MSLDAIRDKLVAIGADDADKDELTTIGLGFT